VDADGEKGRVSYGECQPDVRRETSRLPQRHLTIELYEARKENFEIFGRLESDNTSAGGFFENLLFRKFLMSFAYISAHRWPKSESISKGSSYFKTHY